MPPPCDACREIQVPNFDAGPSDPILSRVTTLVHRFLRQACADEDDLVYVNLFEALRFSCSQ